MPFVSLEQLCSINRSDGRADGYTFKKMQQADFHDSAHEYLNMFLYMWRIRWMLITHAYAWIIAGV